MEISLDAVGRARTGDLEAFEELVHAWMPSIYRLARAHVGEAAADDVVQDAFLAAWRELPRLRDPDRFVPWLHRIALNRCRSVLRSPRRVRELPIDGHVAAERSASPDFRQAIETNEGVHAAFRRLTDDQRAVIALHYAAGLTHREVAAVLGIPEGTVKSRLAAALAALRVQLTGVDR